MEPFEFLLPRSIDELLEAIAVSQGEDVMLWGGGTATTLMMQNGLVSPRRLVGLRKVPGLEGISLDDAGDLRIGAATRLRAIERSELLQRVLPSLAAAAAHIGNVRVRNAAMLGGHLVHADPSQDLPPLLLTLDAEVELISKQGKRTVALTDFFVGMMETAIRPDELLTEVRIPAAALARRSRYVKYAPRSMQDYPTVGVACSLELADDGTCREARIAVGGAGPTAKRFPEAEAVVVGQPIDEQRAARAGAVVAEQVEPWDDARGSAGYKRAMSGLWTERLLLSLARSEGERNAS